MKLRASSMNSATGVSGWKKGQRVGVGWHGGHDGTCLECRRGDFRNCRNMKIAGISYDGGYQQYMVAPVEALAAIPESLSDVDAAPLLCAGITTYNALRHSGAMPGDLVAVQGIGGLGHLGDSIREQVWVQGRGDRARPGERDACKKAGSECLYRQQSDQRRGGIAEDGRRTSDSGHGPELQSHVGAV